MRGNPYPFRRSFVPRTLAEGKVVRIRELSAERGGLDLLPHDQNDMPGEAFGKRTGRILAEWGSVACFGRCRALEILTAEVMDVCQEEVRARSRYNRRPSPVEEWTACSEELVLKFARSFRDCVPPGIPAPPMAPSNFRHFCSRILSYCAHFRGDVIHDFLHWSWRTLVSRGSIGEEQRDLDWLDPCAGWGCRLLSACTHQRVRAYHAFDPNRALAPGHGTLVELCFPGHSAASTPGEVSALGGATRIRYESWERGCRGLARGGYDLVFTSPPFFRKEMYHCRREDRQCQASHRYKDKKDFSDRFVKELVVGSHRALRSGGLLALHLPADGEIDEAAMAHASQAGFTRLGVVCTLSKLGQGRWRPIFVWQKP